MIAAMTAFLAFMTAVYDGKKEVKNGAIYEPRVALESKVKPELPPSSKAFSPLRSMVVPTLCISFIWMFCMLAEVEAMLRVAYVPGEVERRVNRLLASIPPRVRLVTFKTVPDVR